jgi:hypothetical protein
MRLTPPPGVTALTKRTDKLPPIDYPEGKRPESGAPPHVSVSLRRRGVGVACVYYVMEEKKRLREGKSI